MGLSCFAITPPGVEGLTAGELRALGLQTGTMEPGGVAFRADQSGLYRANFLLRTANRVIVRAAEFPATSFHELERRARQVPWGQFVASGGTVSFRVTSRKSRLYHGRAVAQRLEEAVARAVRGCRVADGEEPGQEFVVRVFHDRVTISADSSGALLHLRGYRLATAKAPLRETLAAAMLIGSGWNPELPLVDPMCGSGTIPIEAALLARGIPPGRHRQFAFEQWPDFDRSRWEGIRARAEETVLASAPAPIIGSDRDAGAITAAEANAERADVSGDVTFLRTAVSSLPTPAGPGWVVTNPPYGVRLGEADKLRDLFARFGQVLRSRCAGWQFAMLSANRRLEAQMGLPLEDRFRTSNGGIPVRLMTGGIPG